MLCFQHKDMAGYVVGDRGRDRFFFGCGPGLAGLLKEGCAALQLCAASLRRAVQDMHKMKKAVEKLRKQAAKQEKKTEDGTDAAARRVLAGRANFSKTLSSSDPVIIQTIKNLLQRRPMKQVKDVEELTNGTADSSLPFVLKKGRGLSKQLVKDAATRGNLEATLQEFAKKVDASKDNKSMFLGRRQFLGEMPLYIFVDPCPMPMPQDHSNLYKTQFQSTSRQNNNNTINTIEEV